jgi:acyl-CoA reductase-like NAD-dependent aldehyde dehydrogenase
MDDRQPWTLHIGGERREAASGEVFVVEEPATGEFLAEVAAGGPEDIDEAVQVARRAYDEHWRSLAGYERAALLSSIADVIREHADELAELETREMGKPLDQARQFDVRFASAVFDYYAGLADKLNGEHIPQGPIDAHTVLEPYGVVGAIIPFNWPPIHLAGKAAPALAAGNTLVMKPGEQAPLTAIKLTELMAEVLPPGAVNVVPGLGAAAGAALVSHPQIGKVSFTGATATGRAVLRGAAENITPAVMELGGKNPFIVMPDAHLEAAVLAALEGMFFNQGEACTAASRILLHAEIHDRFLEMFCPAVESLVVGDGLDQATDLGPLVTRQQQQRVLEYIRIGEEEGAKIIARGRRPDDPRLENGFFVEPIVFGEVDNHMRIAQEEIFGPVTTIIEVQDYDDAIRTANDTAFGLVAAVYTGDTVLADRAAREIEAGVVFINNYHRGFLGMPFGGMKASGYGREHGTETIREFVRTKAVRRPSGLGEIPRWKGARLVDGRGGS